MIKPLKRSLQPTVHEDVNDEERNFGFESDERPIIFSVTTNPLTPRDRNAHLNSEPLGSSGSNGGSGIKRRYWALSVLAIVSLLSLRIIKSGSSLKRSILVLSPPGGFYTEQKLNPTEHSSSTSSDFNSAFEAKQEKQCNLWMAPSSLPGDFSGYGIFVTRNIKAGESIIGRPDGVGIPISASYRATDPKKEVSHAFRNFFYEYVWARGMPDHVLYDSPPDTVDYQTGMGSLPNHHCVLSHLSTIYPHPPYDDSLVDRFIDPGAGGFTYNLGREFITTHDVAAGDELFLNYGLCSKGIRESGGWYSNLLITEDFNQAASVIHRARFGSTTELRFDPVTGNSIVSSSVGKFVESLLPTTRLAFQKLLNEADNYGGSHATIVRQVALATINRRTPEWIQKKGLCLENLIEHSSTIHGAGHGGFAQRTLRKGDIIAPVPLLQIMNHEALKVYNQHGVYVETQLLLNYCFGHKSIDLLLCPNTNAVLINHCSSRSNECGKNGPNAEFRWASSWDQTTLAWLNMTIDELSAQSGHGLSLEIVATRTILTGEEVFMDYGEEWEQAWISHVKNYKPPVHAPSFSNSHWVTAKVANENMGPIIDELVAGDIRGTVDHPYLFTGCQYWTTSWDDKVNFKSKYMGDWRNASDETLLRRFADSGIFFNENAGNRERDMYDKHGDQSYWPCTVLRHESDGLYIVRIHRPFFASKQPWEINDVPRFLTNYSRELIHYFVRPYAGDQHLPGVFRHAIGLRDDMIPAHWTV